MSSFVFRNSERAFHKAKCLQKKNMRQSESEISSPEESDSHISRRKFLACGCAGCAGIILTPAAVLYDSFRIEPNWPEVTKYDVEFIDYPSDVKPLKILQISDIHRGPYVSEEHIRKLVNLCNHLSPDIVVITGDFISKKKENAASCAQALSGLKSRMGIFGVMGNHDYWAQGKVDVVSVLQSAGIRMFKNGNIKLFDNVWLIGIDDNWAGKPDIPAAFSGVPENAVRIVITHTPKIFPKIRDMNVFAMVGHTHGGQYNIPFVPRKYLPGLLGWEYIKGWYTEGNSRMYVNRGIGMIAAPVRFCCRPEITVYSCGPVKSATKHV